MYIRTFSDIRQTTAMFIYFGYMMTVAVVGMPLTYAQVMPVWVFVVWTLTVIPAFGIFVFSMYLEDRLARLITRRWTHVLDRRGVLTMPGYVNNELISQRLKPAVREWCRENLAGYVGVHSIPRSDRDRMPLIWFSNPHDAMHFKLRWL